MTLSQLASRIIRSPRKPAPTQPVHIVNVGDYVLTTRGFGIVTDISIPYCDGIRRAYVEGIAWTDWLEEADIV